MTVRPGPVHCYEYPPLAIFLPGNSALVYCLVYTKQTQNIQIQHILKHIKYLQSILVFPSSCDHYDSLFMFSTGKCGSY